MHYIPNRDAYPQMCLDVGKDCVNCVTDTAAEAQRVCPGLKGKAINQLFVLLYPNAGCAPMSKRFAAEYREAPGTLVQIRKPNRGDGAPKVREAVA
jgi:hypothetical protein